MPADKRLGVCAAAIGLSFAGAFAAGTLVTSPHADVEPTRHATPIELPSPELAARLPGAGDTLPELKVPAPKRDRSRPAPQPNPDPQAGPNQAPQPEPGPKPRPQPQPQPQPEPKPRPRPKPEPPCNPCIEEGGGED